MRTFDRDTFDRASALWAEGEFGSEWDEAKRISWERGFPFPPTGTQWDSREEGSPSQRAIVYAALDDRPKGTLEIIRRSRSWGEVVSAIFGVEAQLREQAGIDEIDAALERASRPSHTESVEVLRDVLDRIGR
jgi:hypothetical protein